MSLSPKNLAQKYLQKQACGGNASCSCGCSKPRVEVEVEVLPVEAELLRLGNTEGDDLHPEGENYMSVQALQAMADHATALLKKIDTSTNLPDWVESKIIRASAGLEDVMEFFAHGYGQRLATGVEASKANIRPLSAAVEDMLLRVKDLRGNREYERYALDFDMAVQDSDVASLLSMGGDLAYDISRMDDRDILPAKWKKISDSFRSAVAGKRLASGLTELEAYILEFIGDSGQGFTASEISGELEISLDKAQRSLSKIVDAGYLQSRAGSFFAVAGKRLASTSIPVVLKKELKLRDGTVIPVGSKGDLEFKAPSEWSASVGFDALGGRRVSLNSKNLFGYFGRPFTPAPSLSALEKMGDGLAKSVTGKTVEPDGYGPDGSPSWLLVLGYI